MIHGYEEASIAPAIDLFDSGIIQQMVAAAREQYLQGQNDLDNFYKQYGDFLSPSAKDMDYYYNNTVGQINDLFNYAQSNGIDLLRSAEGRALIANTRRNIPHATLGAIRQNAKKLEDWQKLAAQMKANGTYGSDDFQRFVNGGVLPEDFSTVDKNGNVTMFNSDGPVKFQTLNEATGKWYEGRTPYDLSKAQVEKMGVVYDPRYRYTGFDYDDLVDTAGSQTQGWMSSPVGRWYYEQARRKIAAKGGDPTDEKLVQAQLNNDVAQANMRFMVKPNGKHDDYAYLAAQTQAQRWLDEQKAKDQLIANGYGGKQTQPVGYSTLTNAGSLQNVNKNGGGIDYNSAVNGLRRRMNEIIPSTNAADKANFKTNFSKLSKDKQSKYNRIKTIYDNVVALQSPDKNTRERAEKWFKARPNAYVYAFAPIGRSGQELTKVVNNIFGQYEFRLESGLADAANRLLAKGQATQSPWKGKYRKIDLSKTSGIRFSPITKANALGGSLYKSDSDERRFDNLLQTVIREGWLVDNAQTSATIGNNKYTTGIATIPYKRLFNASKNDTSWTIAKLNKIGVVVMTSSGDPVDDKTFYKMSRQEQNNVVIKVPITKTNKVDDAATWQDIDTYYMSKLGGTALAREQLVNNQARAFQTSAQMQ